jgi:hypothetical protein
MTDLDLVEYEWQMYVRSCDAGNERLARMYLQRWANAVGRIVERAEAAPESLAVQ